MLFERKVTRTAKNAARPTSRGAVRDSKAVITKQKTVEETTTTVRYTGRDQSVFRYRIETGTMSRDRQLRLSSTLKKRSKPRRLYATRGSSFSWEEGRLSKQKRQQRCFKKSFTCVNC